MPPTSTAIILRSPAAIIPRRARKKKPGPPLTAELRDRFVLVESPWAQLGLLTPRQAVELATALLAAAVEAGSRREAVNAGARRHRREHPVPRWLRTGRPCAAEARR